MKIRLPSCSARSRHFWHTSTPECRKLEHRGSEQTANHVEPDWMGDLLEFGTLCAGVGQPGRAQPADSIAWVAPHLLNTAPASPASPPRQRGPVMLPRALGGSGLRGLSLASLHISSVPPLFAEGRASFPSSLQRPTWFTATQPQAHASLPPATCGFRQLTDCLALYFLCPK